MNVWLNMKEKITWILKNVCYMKTTTKENVRNVFNDKGLEVLAMVWCSCKKCNMSRPQESIDFDLDDDLEGVHT